VGSIIEVKVVRTTRFGAFVEAAEGLSGLVHISEIAHEYVHRVEDHLRKNDVVKAKVIGIRPDGKVELSIKQLEESKKGKVSTAKKRSSDPGFEQMLREFFKRSEENLNDLRNRDKRRA
jgi:S1 RNA binding domain protein